MRTARSRLVVILCVLIALRLPSQNANQPQKATLVVTSEKVIEVPSIASQIVNGIFIPAVDIKKEVNPKRWGKNTAVPGKGLPKGGDPIWEKQKMVNKNPGRDLILDFEAASSGSTPTDPTGAVGPNHFLNSWNSSFRIWDKSGNPLTVAASLSTIFPGSMGDPIVMYDPYADRFFISEFFSNGFDVAVSQGPDPVNDGWYVYRFATNTFPDYPKFSVWSDGYYITANKDQSSPGTSEVVFALERDKMLTGDPTAQMIGFPLTNIVNSGFYSPLGFNCNGSTLPPPGDAPIVYMQDDVWSGVSMDHLKIWNINVDWVTPLNSTISSPQIINTAPFDGLFDGGSFSNLPQPSGSDIDALQATIMYMAQYRRLPTYNTVVFNFVVDLDGNDDYAGIRWYELRQINDGDPWTIHQEGTYSQPDGHSAFCGNMCMDASGNIALAYTVVSSTQFPSLRYTGRYANDPAGTMTITEDVIANGTQSDPSSRYGDYSQMTIDPSDDATFWSIGEYFNGGRKNHVGVFQITPPVLTAQFSGTPQNVCTGNTVTFTDNSLGSPTSWEWTFEGGTPGSFTGETPPPITYNTASTYDVSLEVGDGSTTSTLTLTDYITVQNIIVEFSGTPTTLVVGNNVQFSDLSSCNPTSWLWSFSPTTVTYVGGTDASSQNPQVQFNAGGLYTVSLTATNSYGNDTEIKTDYIDVTDCMVSSFPYLQTFDSWTTSSPDYSCTADGTVTLEECWTNLSGDDIDWDIFTGATASSPTGPDADHTGGGNYLYTEASGGQFCNGSTGYISTPTFDFSALTIPQLRFWYHMYGNQMGTLSVQVSDDGGATWSADVWSLSGDQGNSWQEAAISLSAYALQSNIIIRFTGLTGNGYRSDMAIDDVRVAEETCYCTSVGNMSYETSTTLVDFNTLNNTTAKPAAYNDYTSMSTDVVKGSSYNLTVNVNTDGDWEVHTFAWIDWNQDCDFDDPGEAFDLGTATYVEDGPTSASPYSVTVPADAAIGTTRMRVSTRFDSDPTSCETGFDGEVEDYSVNVLSGLIWTGNTSTDWVVASNWDQNTVPSVYYNVVIPTTPLGGQFPEINSATMDAQTYDLNIESGAMLSIYGALTVNGTLANDEGVGGIIIKSDANQTGSLITDTDNIEATVERYLTDTVAHFIGAPVAGAVIGDLFFDHNPEVWLYQYHENDDSWEYLVPLDTPMPLGQGYYAWVDTTGIQHVTADFQGPLRSSDLTLNSSTTPSVTYTDAAHGVNLLSNPFPSALDWDIGSWQLTNIDGTIYVWSDAGNYLFRNQMELGNLTDGIIPVAQAFSIQADATDPVFTIPADARVHHTQQFYLPGREVQNDISLIVLEMVNSGKRDEVWITFNNECTEEYDDGWDVYKRYGDENSPQLYLQESVFELSIDALPDLTGNGKIIPLNFIAGANGQHELLLKDLVGLEDVDIILEDLFTDHSHIFSIDPLYRFTASLSDSPDRFLLHIGATVTGKDEIKEESLYSIYSVEKTIYIKRNGKAKDQNIDVQLFDIYGRVISEKSFSPSHLDRINTNIDYNIVIVRVIGEKGEMVSEKVFIK